MLALATVEIISQYVNASNQQAVYLKVIQCHVNCISTTIKTVKHLHSLGSLFNVK